MTFQAKYIAQCIEEIKQELRQENISVKANAVAKLTYVRFMFYIIKKYANLLILLITVANDGL